MRLTKSRFHLVLAIVFLIAPPLLAVAEASWIVALPTLLGVALLSYARLPFRFVIGPEGLDVRAPGIQRRFAWSDLDQVALDLDRSERPRSGQRLALFAVPAEGGDRVKLLNLDSVRETPEAIAAALAAYAGPKFVDLRDRQARFAADFPTVPDGYDPVSVDKLVADARVALRDVGGLRRLGARASIEAFLAKPRTAGTGYDRGRVDAVLRAVAADLTDWPARMDPGTRK